MFGLSHAHVPVRTHRRSCTGLWAGFSQGKSLTKEGFWVLLYHSSDSPLNAFLASKPLCVLISAHFSGFVGSLSLLSFSQMKHFSFLGSFGLLEVHVLLHFPFTLALCAAQEQGRLPCLFVVAVLSLNSAATSTTAPSSDVLIVGPSHQGLHCEQKL